jgi:hypothetical protein
MARKDAKQSQVRGIIEWCFFVLQSSKLLASCDQIENSPGRRPSASLRTGSRLREKDFEIKNLCELCVLCGESLFSDLVAAVPRCALRVFAGETF